MVKEMLVEREQHQSSAGRWNQTSTLVKGSIIAGVVFFTASSILLSIGSVLYALMISPRFFLAVGGSIFFSIGAHKFAEHYNSLSPRGVWPTKELGPVSKDDRYETGELGFISTTNGIGFSESEFQEGVATPLSQTSEEPISFFLLDEGGIKIASLDFCPREQIDENLMSGFFSAIQAFSDEVFAQNINQIQLEDFTLLLKSFSSLTFVYIFRGPVEPAEEKLNLLIRRLAETSIEWSGIVSSSLTGRVLPDDTRFAVESLVRTNLCPI